MSKSVNKQVPKYAIPPFFYRFSCRRTPEGSTSLHAACYGSNMRVLRRLIEAGGDTRLHDINGLLARNWATRQLNISRRRKNLALLSEAQNEALFTTGRVNERKQGTPGYVTKSRFYQFLLTCH